MLNDVYFKRRLFFVYNMNSRAGYASLPHFNSTLFHHPCHHPPTSPTTAHEPPRPSNPPPSPSPPPARSKLVVLLPIAISVSKDHLSGLRGLRNLALDSGLHTFCCLVRRTLRALRDDGRLGLGFGLLGLDTCDAY